MNNGTDAEELDLSQQETIFRCGSRLHGVRIGNVLEIVCRDCRKNEGRQGVVAHYFNIDTGMLIKSKRYDSMDNLRRVKLQARKRAIENSAKSAAD